MFKKELQNLLLMCLKVNLHPELKWLLLDSFFTAATYQQAAARTAIIILMLSKLVDKHSI